MAMLASSYGYDFVLFIMSIPAAAICALLGAVLCIMGTAAGDKTNRTALNAGRFCFALAAFCGLVAIVSFFSITT